MDTEKCEMLITFQWLTHRYDAVRVARMRLFQFGGDETTHHISYTRSNVAAIHRRNICRLHGTKKSKIPWKHHPEPVAENQEVCLLIVIEIRTDKVIPAPLPCIVLID